MSQATDLTEFLSLITLKAFSDSSLSRRKRITISLPTSLYLSSAALQAQVKVNKGKGKIQVDREIDISTLRERIHLGLRRGRCNTDHTKMKMHIRIQNKIYTDIDRKNGIQEGRMLEK